MQCKPSFSLDEFHDPADWCAWCGTRLPQDAYWGRRKYCSRDRRKEQRFGREGKTRADVVAA